MTILEAIAKNVFLVAFDLYKWNDVKIVDAVKTTKEHQPTKIFSI